MNKRKKSKAEKGVNSVEKEKVPMQGKKNTQERKMIYTIAAVFIMMFALLIGYMV